MIIDEEIIRISPDGIVQQTFSILDVLRASQYKNLVMSVNNLKEDSTDIDILHVNHVEVFDGTRSSVSPLFRRGNVLISIKHMNAVAIIDGVTRETGWLWGPSNVSLQHHPTLLENGNILLFDNGLSESRVVEVEVPSGRIAWTYENGVDFYSYWGGSSQRLANGNTLITDTAHGRVFEVTQKGRIVWEFANPIVNDQDGTRLNVWRMTRFNRAELEFLTLLQ
jgi:hypothetical protein